MSAREKPAGGKPPVKSNIHWADQMAFEIRERLENDTALRAIVERQGLLIYDANGRMSVRYFSLEGDELKLSTPPIPSSSGPWTSDLVWKRAR